MGIMAKIKDFLEPVIHFIEVVFDWVADSDNQEEVTKIIQIILTIISTVGALNEPIPKRDRPKAVRTTLEILQKISPEDLRELAKIKEETEFDRLRDGDLDARIGLALGGFVGEEKKRRKKGKAG